MSLGQAVVDVAGNTKPLKASIGGVAGDLRKAILGSAVGNIIADGVAFIARQVLDLGKTIGRLALGGGLNRVLDTEDARKTFDQLGLSLSEIDTLFGQLQHTFGRSAFTFPDVFDISSQLKASGAALEDLDMQMANVGNVAALAKTDLTEIGDIFVKIGAEGQLSGRRLNQFATRGVNMAAILAEALGVTEAEFRKMVSAGEVSADMMHQLLAESDTLAGAMDNMATTTRGAWRVFLAGVSGVGEALLAPWFGENGTMVGFLNRVNSLLFDDVIPAVRTFGEAWHAAFTGFTEGGLTAAIEQFRSTFDADVFGQMAGAIRDLVTGGLQFLAANFGDLVDIALQVREALFDALIGAVTNLAAALPTLVPQLVDAIISMVLTIVDTAAQLVPVLVDAAVQLAQGLVTGIVDSLPDIIDGAVQLVTGLITAVVDAAPLLIGAGIELIAGLVTGIISAIPRIQTAVVQLWPVLLGAVIQLLPMVLTLGIRLLAEIVKGIGEAMPDIANTIRNDLIPTLVNTLENEIPQLLAMGVEMVQELATGMVESINLIVSVISNDIIPAIVEMINDNPQIIQAGVDALMALIDGMLDAADLLIETMTDTIIPLIVQSAVDNAPLILQAGITLAVALATGMVQAAPQVVGSLAEAFVPRIMRGLANLPGLMVQAGGVAIKNLGAGMAAALPVLLGFVAGLPGQVFSLLGNVAGLMRQRGGEAMTGLRNGITNRWPVVRSWLSGLPGRIRSGVGNLGRTLFGAGQDLVRGLINGVKSMATAAANAAKGVVNDAIGAAKNLLGISSPSKVFAEIGRDTVRGLALGLAATSELERAADRLARATITAMDVGSSRAPAMAWPFGPPPAAGSTTAATVHVGGITVNVHGATGEQAGQRAAEVVLERLAQAAVVR